MPLPVQQAKIYENGRMKLVHPAVIRSSLLFDQNEPPPEKRKYCVTSPPW
jgi:hypothetical protein